MRRPGMATATASVESRSKKIESRCLSGPAGIREDHAPEGEDEREEPREEEVELTGMVWPPVGIRPNKSSMNR